MKHRTTTADVELRVRRGPCRGVVVYAPASKATPGSIIRVAGWGRHVVREDEDGELYMMDIEPKERHND